MNEAEKQAALARIAARKSQRTIDVQPFEPILSKPEYVPAPEVDITNITDEQEVAKILEQEAIKNMQIRNTDTYLYTQQNNLVDKVIEVLSDESRTDRDI